MAWNDEWIALGFVSPFRTWISVDPLTSTLTPSQLIKRNNKRRGTLQVGLPVSPRCLYSRKASLTLCLLQVRGETLRTPWKRSTVFSPEGRDVSPNSSTSLCSTCRLSPSRFTPGRLNFPRAVLSYLRKETQLNNSMPVSQTLKKNNLKSIHIIVFRLTGSCLDLIKLLIPCKWASCNPPASGMPKPTGHLNTEHFFCGGDGEATGNKWRCIKGDRKLSPCLSEAKTPRRKKIKYRSLQ